jgi:putative ABC transport system permease protein
LIFFLVVVGIIKVLVDLFFRTDLGMTMGAMGNNEQMVISQGVNPKTLKTIGVGLSNGLVAISGRSRRNTWVSLDVGWSGHHHLRTGFGHDRRVSGHEEQPHRRIDALRDHRLNPLSRGHVHGPLLRLPDQMTPNDLNLIKGLLIIVLLIVTQSKKLKRVAIKAMVDK